MSVVSALPKAQHAHPVIIMAGGMGTRLGALTRDMPKPMLPLGDKPILAYLIEGLLQHGFRDIYLSVRYKAEVIQAYFGDGSKWGACISYLEESQPLGTIGALHLLPQRPDLPFLVINGDLVTTLNFSSLLQVHHEQGAMATMCVRPHSIQVPYGVVETHNGQVHALTEKPFHTCYINAGIYAFEPSVIPYIPHDQYCDVTELFDDLLNIGKPVASYVVNELWMDIGQMADYRKAQQLWATTGGDVRLEEMISETVDS